VVPLGLKVPLDKLPPGAYRLDMQAVGVSGTRTPIRSVQFSAE
jgi:hypothetical protein